MTGKLVAGTTVPITARQFLCDQLRFLADQGWEVHLVTAPGPEIKDIASAFEGHPRLSFHTIPMSRAPSPANDALALVRWIALLSRLRPDVVVSGTPKAGLLGMLAARAAGVRSRVYLLRGLRLEGLSGVPAKISLSLERLACAASTSVLCVSPSLQKVAAQAGLAPSDKLIVLGSGSSNGVDINKFSPPTLEERTTARELFGIPEGVIAVGFVGRLTYDKGLPWLFAAMDEVARSRPNVWLVLAGSAIGEKHEYRSLPTDRPWFHMYGTIRDMPQFYRALDLFCLPSLREGFPNSTAEALATGIPAITTDATGCADSVQDGKTGLVVPARDYLALARAIETLSDQEERRSYMGAAGRTQVLNNWSNFHVWRQISAYLVNSLQGAGGRG